MNNVLLMNADGTPISFIPFHKCMLLLFTGKAYTIEESGNYIRTVNEKYPLPSKISLNKYFKGSPHFLRLNKKNIFRRDEYVCQYCFRRLTKNDATIDHVIPKSKGGKHTWENLVTCCHNCNNYKGSKSIGECNYTLLREPKKPNKVMTDFEIKMKYINK